MLCILSDTYFEMKTQTFLRLHENMFQICVFSGSD